MKRPLIAFLLTSMAATLAFGAHLSSQCFLQDGLGHTLDGVSVDDMHPIASVSKVMTSYWAVKTMGANGRYKTVFHLKKIDAEQYDVHIQGSRDPFSDQQMWQYVVGELNKKGIYKIRNLTFDENFKYSRSSPEHPTIHISDVSQPAPDTVAASIRSSLQGLNVGYGATRALALSEMNLSLPESIHLQVSDIVFSSLSDFKPDDFDEHQVYQSAPLVTLLREMNRNSNNFAANQFFESLGGAEQFQVFMEKDLNLGPNEVSFVNGSGDRYERTSQAYNLASCRSIVTVLKAMSDTLKVSHLQLDNVFALAGADEGGASTVSEVYKDDLTNHALVAKTGTVNPAVTLGGVMSTEDGDFYFGYIYATNGSAGDWRSARLQIRAQINNFFRQHAAKPMNASVGKFLPFDSQSTLTKLQVTDPRRPHSLS